MCGAGGGRSSGQAGRGEPESSLTAPLLTRRIILQELLFLRSHYNIEDYLHLSHHAPEEHGRLFHLILSPAFSSLAKHFIKVECVPCTPAIACSAGNCRSICRRLHMFWFCWSMVALQEVLRQSHMTSLYYPLHPSLLPLSHPHKPHTVTTALAEMVPVR